MHCRDYNVLYVYDRYTRSNYVYKDPSVNDNATHKPDIVDNYLFCFYFRINCNFEGVMVNEVFNLSPELEMLRVPLIVRTFI